MRDQVSSVLQHCSPLRIGNWDMKSLQGPLRVCHARFLPHVDHPTLVPTTIHCVKYRWGYLQSFPSRVYVPAFWSPEELKWLQGTSLVDRLAADRCATCPVALCSVQSSQQGPLTGEVLLRKLSVPVMECPYGLGQMWLDQCFWDGVRSIEMPSFASQNSRLSLLLGQNASSSHVGSSAYI